MKSIKDEKIAERSDWLSLVFREEKYSYNQDLSTV
jgi:hypothetical protein